MLVTTLDTIFIREKIYTNKKTEGWLELNRLYLPEGNNTSSVSKKKISQTNNNVKSSNESIRFSVEEEQWIVKRIIKNINKT